VAALALDPSSPQSWASVSAAGYVQPDAKTISIRNSGTVSEANATLAAGGYFSVRVTPKSGLGLSADGSAKTYTAVLTVAQGEGGSAITSSVGLSFTVEPNVPVIQGAEAAKTAITTALITPAYGFTQLNNGTPAKYQIDLRTASALVGSSNDVLSAFVEALAGNSNVGTTSSDNKTLANYADALKTYLKANVLSNSTVQLKITGEPSYVPPNNGNGQDGYYDFVIEVE